MRRLTHTARRRICALALLLTPTLCACSDLRQERRELEQMQIIQTVGVDYAPGGVRLSLAAAAGPEGQGTAPALTGITCPSRTRRKTPPIAFADRRSTAISPKHMFSFSVRYRISFATSSASASISVFSASSRGRRRSSAEPFPEGGTHPAARASSSP